MTSPQALNDRNTQVIDYQYECATTSAEDTIIGQVRGRIDKVLVDYTDITSATFGISITTANQSPTEILFSNVGFSDTARYPAVMRTLYDGSALDASYAWAYYIDDELKLNIAAGSGKVGGVVAVKVFMF